MKGIITEFNQTGESVVNVKAVCKKWDDRFCISVWGNEPKSKYTLIATRKDGTARLLKTEISREQAFEIIGTLGLVNVKSAVFNMGSTYLSKSFAKSKFERLQKEMEEKQKGVEFLQRLVAAYSFAI